MICPVCFNQIPFNDEMKLELWLGRPWLSVHQLVEEEYCSLKCAIKKLKEIINQLEQNPRLLITVP